MTGEKWEKTEEEEEEEEGSVHATYEITRGKRYEITKEEDRFIPWHVSFSRIASCATASSRESLSYASFPFPFDYGQMSFLYSLVREVSPSL